MRLVERLRNVAAERGLSVNRTILEVLREFLGLSAAGKRSAIGHDDLDRLAGTWSPTEARRFEDRLKEQRAIDAALWR
jgi:hypothetical protein